MGKTIAGPRTFLEAINYSSDADVALVFVVALRWSDGEPLRPNRWFPRKIHVLPAGDGNAKLTSRT